MSWEVLFVSGFVGAIAGGLVNLSSQWLNRKWDRVDKLNNEKRQIYSKIISFGPYSHHDENQKELNEYVSRAFLFCHKDLFNSLCEFMNAVGKTKKDGDKITELANKHFEIVELMKKELGH